MAETNTTLYSKYPTIKNKYIYIYKKKIMEVGTFQKFWRKVSRKSGPWKMAVN